MADVSECFAASGQVSLMRRSATFLGAATACNSRCNCKYQLVCLAALTRSCKEHGKQNHCHGGAVARMIPSKSSPITLINIEINLAGWLMAENI